MCDDVSEIAVAEKKENVDVIEVVDNDTVNKLQQQKSGHADWGGEDLSTKIRIGW